MDSYTRQIADFAANLKLSAVPPEVIARAKGIVLDGLGCGLYGHDLKWTDILARVVSRLEPNGGQATLWGRGASASAVNAALVNGTMIQGYELDDTHLNASIHNCATVLPAAFAAAELIDAERVDGARLLTAIIAGFEVGPRVGMCMNGEHTVVLGWHSPAIVSSFPAAIAAGVVLGLNSDQFFHALGIAGTQASGLMAAQYGSMVKRMQCAKGSQSGLYAALLAADGFTGIEDIFEQEYGGFATTFSYSTDKFDLTRLVRGFGERWETMHFTTKIYCCGGGNQTAIDAIDELIREHRFGAADVAEIAIGGTDGMVHHHGWHPYVPNGLTAAQIHAGYCVAMRLIEGDVFVEQMTEANVGRTDLVELANRIRVVRNPERERRGHDFRKGVDMEVKLKDGRTLTKSVDFFRGTDRRPLSRDELTSKYRKLAAKALPRDQVEAIENRVWALDSAPSIAPLVKALAG
jgi:2-methylcitrate dehydratase PrpD